jgi:hypothetical protein
MRSYTVRYNNRVIRKQEDLSEVKLLREPLPEENDKTIIITAGEVEWMQTAWQKYWNRPPTTEEFDGLIQQYINC